MSKLWLCLVALMLAVNVMAQMSEEERINQLQQRVLEQQKILQTLEQQLEQRDETTKVYTQELVQEYMARSMVEEDAGITAGYDKGFFIQSADGDFQLKINGFIRNQLGIYEANTVTNNSFRLTNARVDFNAYVFKHWHFRARPDFAVLETGNDSILRDVYIEYLGMDCLKVRIGSFLVPFSLEVNTDPADTLAIALSPFTTGLPEREVGISVFGNGIPFTKSEFLADHFSYAFGAFNGDTINRLNTNDEMLFSGHMRIYPLGMKEKDVFFQIGSYINDRDAGDGARINLGGLRNHEVFGDLGGAVADVDAIGGRQIGMSAALKYQANNIRFESDFVYVQYDRETAAGNFHDLNLWGISAALGYFIPVGKDKDMGMGIEPVAKMSYTDIDDEDGDNSGSGVFGTLTDVTGQEIWEVTVGARFHFNKHARFDFNWTMYDLDQTRGTNNTDRRSGGGLIHAFLFQSVVRW